MWINRWNSHTTNRSSKEEGDTCTQWFLWKKVSIVLFYKGCVVETSGFEMCVGQSRGDHDGGQFKVYNLYKRLKD